MYTCTNTILGCTKAPFKIPDYAYIVETLDDIWEEKPKTRYPVYWKLGCKNLYSSTDANSENQVNFCNIDISGGFKRVKVNKVNKEEDNIREAFAYVYCKSTNELLLFALFPDEARFGGIVIQPMKDTPFKMYRHKYLMDKWRRLTPLIAKWAIFLTRLHDEIVYRPGNSGAIKCAINFKLLNK